MCLNIMQLVTHYSTIESTQNRRWKLLINVRELRLFRILRN